MELLVLANERKKSFKNKKTKNKKRKTKGKLLDIAIRQAIKVGTKGIRVYKKGVTSSRCGP